MLVPIPTFQLGKLRHKEVKGFPDVLKDTCPENDKTRGLAPRPPPQPTSCTGSMTSLKRLPNTFITNHIMKPSTAQPRVSEYKTCQLN